MRWRDTVVPVRMDRVALVAPEAKLREMLVVVAAAASADLDRPDTSEENKGPALTEPSAAEPQTALSPRDSAVLVPALSVIQPDLAELAQTGRYDLLAGEAEVRGYMNSALSGSGAAALAAWVPAGRVPELRGQLARIGCAIVPLPRSARADAPTLLADRPAGRALAPLVTTYGTVPYADIDPTWPAWVTYVLMFGMMFGDAGHGLLLIIAGLCLRAPWPGWARRFTTAWPFVVGAGAAATAFGLLYGEFFGPTGLVPVLWLAPLARPIPLLATAVGAGAVLLAGAYTLGTLNRWREGGWRLALYAPTGLAGSVLFLGVALAAGGWYLRQGALLVGGGVLAVAGLVLAAAGFAAEAGGGGTGVVRVSIELFDFIIRLGSNAVSFARLAAFGLTHAAIGLVVWEGTQALWHRGGALIPAAIVLFIVGNAVAFALEALVAAIQALRLEYYELFSRVFVTQGRPFRPWAVRVVDDHRAAATPTPIVPERRTA